MPPANRRRFLLIANPIAGRLGRRLLEPTLACLEASGATVTRGPPNGIEDARRAIAQAARDGAVDAVLVAGGDGSFRLAATALLGTSMPIGLIPLGTGNVLAHELDLPKSPYELARILLDGPTVIVKSATANGAPFFLMAGAGFDGAVIARLDHGWKHRVGKAAYVPPVLRALAAPLTRLAITIDGTQHQASWAIVANARCYGGRFVLVPHTHVLDDGLHAVLFQANDRMILTRQLLDLAQGRLLGRPDVRMLPCRRVSIRAEGAIAVQVDGDAGGTTPLDITASDRVVRVIVPDRTAHPGAGGT
jgi:diacylglycerol kinase (ATP)